MQYTYFFIFVNRFVKKHFSKKIIFSSLNYCRRKIRSLYKVTERFCNIKKDL